MHPNTLTALPASTEDSDFLASNPSLPNRISDPTIRQMQDQLAALTSTVQQLQSSHSSSSSTNHRNNRRRIQSPQPPRRRTQTSSNRLIQGSNTRPNRIRQNPRERHLSPGQASGAEIPPIPEIEIIEDFPNLQHESSPSLPDLSEIFRSQNAASAQHEFEQSNGIISSLFC